MKIALLTIGDEVVSGKTVNTNATFLAKVLEAQQYVVTRHLATRDDEAEILAALEFLYQNADAVITTGGLGPTVDDLTKEVCAKYFGEEMVLNEEALAKISAYFKSTGKTMPENNRKQAYFIKDAKILDNDRGTAPGMIYEKAGKIVINLPGPPNELEPMVLKQVLPYLDSAGDHKVLKKQYRLMNIGESDAETAIKDLYRIYPYIKIAPYAQVGIVDYCISTNDIELRQEFEACCLEFERLLSEHIIGDWSKLIQELLVTLLKEKNLTIAIAESCTGGLVTSSIVDIPGSSEVLLEGAVTYSNLAKVKRLGVNEETLRNHGAVSAEVAQEMADGVRRTGGAEIGISTTGIAGPGGGTKDKPVGLVYSAISYNDETLVFKNIFRGDRNKVRLRATLTLLYELYRLIKKTL